MSLPNIPCNAELSLDEDGFLSVYDFEELSELEHEVSETIEADCHAVVMNGEVVYNMYQELTYRERILEYVIREQLSEDTHRHLFVPLLRKRQSFTIELYMFQENPWKIVIEYDISSKEFQISKKVSEYE